MDLNDTRKIQNISGCYNAMKLIDVNRCPPPLFTEEEEEEEEEESKRTVLWM